MQLLNINKDEMQVLEMKYDFQMTFISDFHVESQHLEIQNIPLCPVTVLLKRWHCTYRLPLASALGVDLDVYLKQDGAIPEVASVEDFPGLLGGG